MLRPPFSSLHFLLIAIFLSSVQWNIAIFHFTPYIFILNKFSQRPFLIPLNLSFMDYCDSVTSVCNTVTSAYFSQCRYFAIALKECYTQRLIILLRISENFRFLKNLKNFFIISTHFYLNIFEFSLKFHICSKFSKQMSSKFQRTYKIFQYFFEISFMFPQNSF